MTSSDVDAAIRLLLHRAAHLHYSRRSPTEKSAIRQTFLDMDESRDGRISLREFLQKGTADDHHAGEGGSMSSSYSQIRIIPKLFHYLDSDRSGFLEFDEFLTLHYLMYSGLQLCDSCHNPVMLIGYTCRTCWLNRCIREDAEEQEQDDGDDAQQHRLHHRNEADDGSGDNGNDDDGDTFDLCLSCYASKSYAHQHDDFVDNNTMYNLLMKTSDSSSIIGNSNQVQCSSCGDFHTKELPGILVANQKHIFRSQEKPDEFICEWCSCWMCNNCGNFFQGISSASGHNKWLRTNLCCSLCRTHGTMTDLSQVFKALGSAELNKKCTTCAIKIRKGILWSAYTRRSSDSTAIDASPICSRLTKW